MSVFLLEVNLIAQVQSGHQSRYRLLVDNQFFLLKWLLIFQIVDNLVDFESFEDSLHIHNHQDEPRSTKNLWMDG